MKGRLDQINRKPQSKTQETLRKKLAMTKCRTKTNSSKFLPKKKNLSLTLSTSANSAKDTTKSSRMKTIAICTSTMPVQCSSSATNASKQSKSTPILLISFPSAKIASTIRNVQDARKQFTREVTRLMLKRNNASRLNHWLLPTDARSAIWTLIRESRAG